MTNLLLQNHPNSMNDIPQVTNIGGNKVETYSYKNCPQCRVLVTINPSTAISSNILQGQQLDFRYENQIDRIGGNGVHLRIAYTNNSGNNFVCGPAESWIKTIQIYSNNSCTLLYQTLSNQETYVSNNIVLS